ncbi:MAG: hypothetical protein RIG84_02155 [Roseovarius sp.]
MKTLLLAAAAATAATLAIAQAATGAPEPRAVMVVEHGVADYEAWKAAYDGALEFRRGAGEVSSTILRDETRPGHLTVVMEWTSLERAASFAADPALEHGMRAAGVQLPASITLCESAAALSADICGARVAALR